MAILVLPKTESKLQKSMAIVVVMPMMPMATMAMCRIAPPAVVVPIRGIAYFVVVMIDTALIDRRIASASVSGLIDAWR
jgi:hypothetical protein